AAGRGPGEGEEVLLVDPDAAFAKSCSRFLERAGYSVHVAATAERAAQLAAEHDLEVVLVHVSFSRPESRLMQAVCGHAGGPDVLVMADYAELHKRRRSRGIPLPSEAYLPKPFEPRQLLARISRLLAVRKEPITAYLRRHLAEIHTREQVADLFRASEGTVLNRVAKATGMSFLHFLQTCRVEETRRLLVYSELTVQQIAAHVGLTSTALARLCRRVTGRSPLDLRRQSRLPPP
ncbi:MAG: DNA-binding response regulator, partial [Candidatus Latescibacterota bacterium]